MSASVNILLLAIFFGFVETAYFGWNMTPQSDAEIICDGIVFVLVALSFVARR